MNDELRAAAERLIDRYSPMESSTCPSCGKFMKPDHRDLNLPSRRWQCECGMVRLAVNEPDNDVVRFADAVLAEHPADEDTPIDEAWLRSVGFCPHQGTVGIMLETLPGVYLSWSVKEGMELDGSWLKHFNTRGQLRDLCRVLGIELEEPT